MTHKALPYLYVHPSLDARPVAPGQWLVRGCPHGQQLVRGPSWLARLFRALGAGVRLPELIQRLDGEARPDEVREAVFRLLDAGIAAQTADPPSDRDAAADSLEAYLSRWQICPARVRAVQSACLIGVAATGMLARDMFASLASAGLAARLIAPGELEDQSAGAVLLVGVVDHPDNPQCEAVSRAARQHGIPWLHAAISSDEVWIGPLFVPHETACWHCFRHRLNSNRRYRALHEQFLAAPPLHGSYGVPAAAPFARRAAAELAALEVLRFLFRHEPPQSVGHLLTVRLSDYATRREAVLKIPGCSECQHASAGRTHASGQRRDREDHPSPPGARRFADVLIGRHCGIVRDIRPVPRRWDDPKVSIVAAELADTTAFGAPACVQRTGGVGLTHDEAWSAALGEAAERYAAVTALESLPRREGTWADLQPDEAVDPHRLALFSHEQYRQPGFPFRPFTRTTRTAWVRGWRMSPDEVAHRPCWLPADCVGLAAKPSGPDGPWTVATSTGLAAGPSRDQALLAALCEVIERDAFVVAWFNHLSAPRVDLNAPELDWLRGLLENYLLWPQIEYHVADLTSDVGVPVYAAISRGPSEDGPIVSFGAACHPCARHALTAALLEAAATRVYVRQCLRLEPRRRYRRDFADVCTFEDHAQFYTRHPRYWRRLRSLVSTTHLASLEALASPTVADAEDPGSITRRVEALGMSVYWCDLTTPDVSAADMHVVRVLVPGMQLLHGDHRFPFLGGQRHRDPAGVFAWLRPKWRRRSARRMPHPYP